MGAILLLESRAEELRALLSTKASGLAYCLPDDGYDAVARCDIWLGEPDRAVSLLAAGHRPAWLQSTWAGFKPLLAAGLPQDYRLSRAVGGVASRLHNISWRICWRTSSVYSHCRHSSNVRNGIASCPGC